MGQSQRLRHSDLRAVYLLVGECREYGADPVVWRHHLLEGLERVLGGVVGLSFEFERHGAAGQRPDWVRPTRLRQVLVCLLEGDGEKQVASRLGIRPSTAHVHVKRLYRALSLTSRGELLSRWTPLLPVVQQFCAENANSTMNEGVRGATLPSPN